MDFIEGLPQSSGKNTILLLLITLVSQHISWHWLIPTLQKWWLRSLWKVWWNSMVCQDLSLVIRIQYLSVIFCVNFSRCQALNWRWVSHIIRRQMVNLKLSTDVLNNIFDALCISSPENGVPSFLRLSSGITRPITHPREWRPSRLCMGTYHQQFHITKWVCLQWMK